MVPLQRIGLPEMDRRTHPRFNKSLVAQIAANDITLFVITGDLSKKGFFIRSKQCFAPETNIDIEIATSDNKVSHLKGVVRRTVDTSGSMNSGMGVEILEEDSAYIHFLKSLAGETEENAVEAPATLCSQVNASSTGQTAYADVRDDRWDTRRRYRRYLIDEKAIAVIIGASDEAKVVDLSAGGISFKTEKMLDHGKEYEIDLYGKDGILTLRGVIKWISLNEYTKLHSQNELIPKYTIGMQFTDFLGNTSDEVVQFLDSLPKRDAIYSQDEPVDLSKFILSDWIELATASGKRRSEKNYSSQNKRNKNAGEKRASAAYCGREERFHLLRDPNKEVVLSVLKNPKITNTEIEKFAQLHTMPEEAISTIIQNKAWINHYGIVSALVNNPKTPPSIAATLVNKLKKKDLRKLERNKGVCEVVRKTAKQLLSRTV